MATTRLDPKPVAEIIDRLDDGEVPGIEVPGDVGVFSYRRQTKVSLRQPGEVGPTKVMVPSRTITSSGFTFLYGSFLHTGTICDAQFVTTFGSWVDVPGTVSNCSYIEKKIHHVGCTFSEPIHPPLFVRDASSVRSLVVEDCECNVLLLTAHLKSLRAEVDVARNGLEAVERCLSAKYDIIFMDIEMPEMDGCEATKALRAAGYCGVIVAISAHSNTEDRLRCQAAGCNQFLAKPFQREDIANVLTALQEEPLYSNSGDQPALMPAIRGFVDALPARARALEQAMVTNDTATFQETLKWLQANGASFGFPTVTDLAARIRTNSAGTDIPAYCQEDAIRLVRMCLQARAVPGCA